MTQEPEFEHVIYLNLSLSNMSCTVKMLMEMDVLTDLSIVAESADPASDSNQSNSGLSGTIDELQGTWNSGCYFERN